MSIFILIQEIKNYLKDNGFIVDEKSITINKIKHIRYSIFQDVHNSSVINCDSVGELFNFYKSYKAFCERCLEVKQ